MNWRTGDVKPGHLVKIDPTDFGRIGHCWMRGRLHDGDLAMAVSLSGDCFWTYMLVRHDYSIFHPATKFIVPGYKLIKESSFGAYVMGTPYQFQPSEREFHLLMAGEDVSLQEEQDHLAADKLHP